MKKFVAIAIGVLFSAVTLMAGTPPAGQVIIQLTPDKNTPSSAYTIRGGKVIFKSKGFFVAQLDKSDRPVMRTVIRPVTDETGAVLVTLEGEGRYVIGDGKFLELVTVTRNGISFYKDGKRQKGNAFIMRFTLLHGGAIYVPINENAIKFYFEPFNVMQRNAEYLRVLRGK
ncbi:MAG: hypothetical protein Q7S28_04075 [bacterium]|nr:hypothetical protein [bacterium]